MTFVEASIEDDPADNPDVTSDTINLGASLAYQIIDHEIGEGAAGEPLTVRLAPLVGALHLPPRRDRQQCRSQRGPERDLDPAYGPVLGGAFHF